MKRHTFAIPLSVLALIVTAGCTQARGPLNVITPQTPAESGQREFTLQSVSFDSSTGQGFVGKGDVQTAFGWNNAQLQANAGALTFTYVETATYEAVAEWTTGPSHNRTTHEVTQTRSSSVKGSVLFDARKQTQITGFNLTGLGEVVVSGGPIPTVGSPALGIGTNAIWTSVTQISSTTGLFVQFGDQTVQLQ